MATRWRAGRRGGGNGFGGFGGLGDVFEAFFGGGGGDRADPIGRVRPGSDSLLRMRLDLTECATGVTKQVTVDTAILCDQLPRQGHPRQLDTGDAATPATARVRCSPCSVRCSVRS